MGTCDSRETPAQTTSQDSADRAGHCRHTRHRAATYRRPSATATSREAAVAAGRVPRETRRLAAISSARYRYGSARRVQTTMYPPAVPEVATACTRRERHPQCPPHPWTSRKIALDLHGQPEEEQWLHLARSPLARPRDTICDSPHSRTAMKRARPIQRASDLSEWHCRARWLLTSPGGRP